MTSFKENSMLNILNRKYDHGVAEFLLSNNSRILDYGCGDCRFFDRVKGKFNNLKLVGYDINNSGINIARKKGYKVYSSLDKIKGKFNYVIANRVIECLDLQQAFYLFKQSGRLLNKDGRLLLSALNTNEFFNIRNFWNDLEHVRLYPIIALEDLAKQNNFKLVEVYKYGSRTNPFKLITNLFLGMSSYTGLTLVFEKA